MRDVSDAALHRREEAIGDSSLPADLTEEQLTNAPRLASADDLVVDGLSDEDDDAFAAALEG
jgi:hypothetical protein